MLLRLHSYGCTGPVGKRSITDKLGRISKTVRTVTVMSCPAGQAVLTANQHGAFCVFVYIEFTILCGAMGVGCVAPPCAPGRQKQSGF